MQAGYYSKMRCRFTVAVTVVVLVLAGLFYWYGSRERQLVFSGAEKRSASYASALKEHAERVFSEADNSLDYLISEINEHGGIRYAQSPGFHRILRERAKNFSSIYVVDSAGDIIAHSLDENLKPVNLAERDYFQHHRNTPLSGLFISRPFKSKVSNTWRFSLSRPLRDAQGGFAGLVSVSFEADYFGKFYKTIDVGTRGRIMLSTTAGDLLVIEPRYDKTFEHDFKKSILFSTYLLNAPIGTHHVLSPISGDMKIVSYNSLTNIPLVAIVSFDEAETTALWLAAIYKQSAIGALLLGLLGVLSWLFLKQLKRLEQVDLKLAEQQADLDVKKGLLDEAADAVESYISERKEIEQTLEININNLKNAEHREQVRSSILERIAAGEPLSQLLSFIAVSIEKENPEMLCSILLVSDDGKRLLNGAAPSLPAFYNMATHRTKIGEGIGSCGTAAFRRERVIVEDIENHPFWKGFTPASEAGLRACWSEPIISSAGVLLGTFAIYHRAPATPGEGELALIQQASAFAGIAIERSKGEAERIELEHLLSQAQKMEAIGHLSGGIAHDFNNLLTPILIYSDMLKRSLPDNEKMRSQLDGIIKASGKARDLTQQLLSFGRKQVMQMQVVDLNDVIMSFHPMLRSTLRENITLNLQLSSQAAVVRADCSKLEQVLLNLVLNAQDAIADNGKILIETGQVLIDDEFAHRHPGMNPGRFVLMSCTDNGCGMSSETMARIFEPFFSTKEVGHGTGLGLANVYGIIKQHNGYILATSAVGVATVFKIYLPVCTEKAQSLPAVNDQPVLDHNGSAEILLVEDNAMVRIMSSELLTGLGYTVHSAEHPERALELLKTINGKIDLVITDVVMPGMDG